MSIFGYKACQVTLAQKRYNILDKLLILQTFNYSLPSIDSMYLNRSESDERIRDVLSVMISW